MKYRKKPIVIEAFQMTRERRYNNSEWPDWLHESWNLDRDSRCALFIDWDRSMEGVRLGLTTFEGEIQIEWDDWIIQGVQGELYPCKPYIFEATYEPVGDA